MNSAKFFARSLLGCTPPSLGLWAVASRAVLVPLQLLQQSPSNCCSCCRLAGVWAFRPTRRLRVDGESRAAKNRWLKEKNPLLTVALVLPCIYNNARLAQQVSRTGYTLVARQFSVSFMGVRLVCSTKLSDISQHSNDCDHALELRFHYLHSA